LGLNRSDINTVRALRESARQLCRMKRKKLPRWCQSARVCVVVLESWVEEAQFLGTSEKAISYHLYRYEIYELNFGEPEE